MNIFAYVIYITNMFSSLITFTLYVYTYRYISICISYICIHIYLSIYLSICLSAYLYKTYNWLIVYKQDITDSCLT